VFTFQIERLLLCQAAGVETGEEGSTGGARPERRPGAALGVKSKSVNRVAKNRCKE